MKKGFLLTLAMTLLLLIVAVAWYFSSEFRRQLFFANQGNAEAQIFIATIYQNGTTPVAKNLCQAHQWWAKAAAQNNATAQITLGNLYIENPQEHLECLYLPQNLIKNYVTLATENGNYQGYYKLAEYHAKDTAQKIHYLEHGALHDEPDALYALSSYYFSRNHAYSLYLLEKSAKLGNIKAQTFLGDIHAGMTYTSKYMDFAKALEWYSKAAKQGDNTAQKNLALLHLYGQGTEQNYDKAAYYLKQSADQGDKESLLTLTMLIMYDRGLSINTYGSKNQSLKVINTLANQDYVEAQVELARLHLFGIGVLQDYKKAAEWFQKAANQSDRLAQYQLGLLYATGKGVVKNPQKAQALFYQSRYKEYIDTSKPNGKGIIDEGFPYFKVY